MSLEAFTDEELRAQIAERQAVLYARETVRGEEELRRKVKEHGYVLSATTKHVPADLRATTIKVYVTFAAGTPDGDALALAEVEDCELDFVDSFQLQNDLVVGDFTRAFRAQGNVELYCYTPLLSNVSDGEYQRASVVNGCLGGTINCPLSELGKETTLITLQRGA
jgi:hypothetical protein